MDKHLDRGDGSSPQVAIALVRTLGVVELRKFWLHALRSCFIIIADRDLMLPNSLTKRLVNHARPADLTEGYAADWTIGQLRESAQCIADRLDELIQAGFRRRGSSSQRGDVR